MNRYLNIILANNIKWKYNTLMHRSTLNFKRVCFQHYEMVVDKKKFKSHKHVT